MSEQIPRHKNQKKYKIQMLMTTVVRNSFMMTMVYDANADPILQEAEAEAVMRACVLANQVSVNINIMKNLFYANLISTLIC